MLDQFLMPIYFQIQEKNYEFSGIGDLFIFILLIFTKICISPLTLIASCVGVMTMSNLAIRLTDLYLASCKRHAPANRIMSSGVTEAVVMFILALQVDLIDLKIAERAGAMSIILYIVAASLLQTLLEITHPVLLALAASSKDLVSHVKVLILCAILFAIPAYMSYLLISTIELDLWTMVVVSSSVMTSIQVVGHLIHYGLYLYDTFRSEPMETLDDTVYYLKSIVHSIELMSALIVVCAGLKEFYSGQWSFLNSFVLVIHCYFNVWVRIKNGWRSFLLRQVIISFNYQWENNPVAFFNDCYYYCGNDVIIVNARLPNVLH